MKNFKFLTIFIITLLSITLTKPAFAGFGVSPVEIYSDNLKPGAKFEKEIVLSRSDFDENLNIVIETDLGEAESWIKFNLGKNFIFPKGEQRKIIKVSVAIPNDAPLKNYKGVLRIKASSTDSSNSGVSVVKGARMEVNLITTSLNVDILNIKNLNIPSIDFQKPIKLIVTVENKGNTEISPSKVTLEVQNLNKKVIETQEVFKLDKTPANTTKEITAEFKNNLDSGEYFGIVKVYLGDKMLRTDRLVFKIGPAPEGYKASNNTNSVNSFMSMITNSVKKSADILAAVVKENKVETAAIALVPIVPIAIGLIVFKLGVIVVAKEFFIIGTVIYIIANLALTSLYHFQWKNQSKQGDKGNVQGEFVEITSNKSGDQSNLVVGSKVASYPIYRIPDKSSPVVFTAGENQKFTVLEENDNWYRVSTGNGTGGWLPKSSVKKTE